MNDAKRQELLARYDRVRARSHEFFAALDDSAYFSRPIALRHPFVFYEGHLSAFAYITLCRRALKHPAVDEKLETLFQRGIDPENEGAAPQYQWPSRALVAGYVESVDRNVRHSIENERLVDDANPLLRRAEAVFCVIEHEQMHHETLRYMLHEMRRERPVAAAPASAVRVDRHFVSIPPGETRLGADPSEIAFGWDNESPAADIEVERFSISATPVTNGEFVDFVDAGGYANAGLWSGEAFQWIRTQQHTKPHFWERRNGEWFWRSIDSLVPLPVDAPVWVTQAEAVAYAQWKKMRLPTETEFHRAAFSTPDRRDRRHPWGDDPPDATRGNFDFVHNDPQPVGSYPAGASAWGVLDLVGNGWEWTSTPFAPFRGFVPMSSYPLYSADFFDGRHFVMKGGSPATDRDLIRRSFRNWFRPTYPYVYAKFRLVR